MFQSGFNPQPHRRLPRAGELDIDYSSDQNVVFTTTGLIRCLDKKHSGFSEARIISHAICFFAIGGGTQLKVESPFQKRLPPSGFSSLTPGRHEINESYGRKSPFEDEKNMGFESQGGRGGWGTLVFAGGIGEHAPPVRARICDGRGFLGVVPEGKRNTANEAVISNPAGQVVRVMHTYEERMIGRAVCRVLGPASEKEN